MQPLAQTLVASTLSLRDSRVQMRLSYGGPAYLFTQLAKRCSETHFRLRVVPHFSSGIVERAKRERA